MDTNKHFFAALALLVPALTAHAEVNVAIVRLHDDGASYLYSSRKIGVGDTVYFQVPKHDKPTCCEQSPARAAVLLKPDDAAVDYDADRRLFRYRLALKDDPDALPFIGIAAVGKGLRVEGGGPWSMRVHQAGRVTELSLCTSTEGVHVTAAGKGERKRHVYLYLGYDIENPTCKGVDGG